MRRSLTPAESAALLAALTDASADAIIAQNLEGVITLWNPGAERVFGYSEDEMLGRSVVPLIPLELRAQQEDLVGMVRRGLRLEQFQARRVRKDGALIDVSLTLSPVRDAAGEVSGVTAIVRDLTEHRRAESALRDREERLRTVVANLSEGLVIADPDARALEWNPAALRMHGFADEEEARRRRPHFATDFILTTLEGEPIPHERWPLRRILTGEEIRECDVRVRRLDQGWDRVFRYGGAMVQAPGGRRLAYVTIQDITARTLAEEERRRTEHLFSSFMDNLPGFAWIKDREGRYTYANRSARVALGAAGHWVGKTDAELCDPELAEVYLRNDRKVIDTKAPVEAVETLIVSGSRRVALNSKFPIFAPDGEVAFVCGIGVEITEQHRVEQQLRQSEAELRALAAQLVSIRERESGRIAREIHDEMGQALTGLKMDVHWLQEQLAASGEPLCTDVHARLDAISRALDRTAEATRKVCAELRPGVLDELGLLAALEWQAQEFEARSAIFCNLILPPTDPPLSPACAITVFRIFQEVLTNVARHSGATEVEVRLEVAEGQLRLTVSDNGIGIPESKLAGSGGLGLVGMRERALAAEGILRIEGGSGGTRVVLEIPVKEAS